jgi:PIN domain nuclease of toxin-antitoxin system
VSVLLDTHVLLWWLTDDDKLADPVRRLIGDGSQDVFVSSVSIAEIAIKSSLGKLAPIADMPDLIATEGFTELPLSSVHAAQLADLPWIHRDPFDRMLIAQAQIENLSFVTADDRCRQYDVVTIAAT